MLLRPCLITLTLTLTLALTSVSAPAQQANSGAQRANQAQGAADSQLPLEEEDIEALIANSVELTLKEPVRVKSGMISVNLHRARFGKTLKEIGRQAGFKTVISPRIAKKRLTTSFRDIELLKGIQRLLSLISHRNFFIYYGANNSITKIEIYDSNNAAKSGGKATSPSGAKSNVKKNRATPPPVTRRLPNPETSSGEDKANIPYIVPRQEPQYVPPYNRSR